LGRVAVDDDVLVPTADQCAVEAATADHDGAVRRLDAVARPMADQDVAVTIAGQVVAAVDAAHDVADAPDGGADPRGLALAEVCGDATADQRIIEPVLVTRAAVDAPGHAAAAGEAEDVPARSADEVLEGSPVHVGLALVHEARVQRIEDPED